MTDLIAYESSRSCCPNEGGMMSTLGLKPDCQIKNIYCMANGPQEKVPLDRTVRLFLRKMIGAHNVRRIKNQVYEVLNSFGRLIGKDTTPATIYTSALNLKTGDQVRIRSRDEIKATLNHWAQLKGCSFLPEMVQYCDTIQRVLKPVERFVDERDLRIRRTKGIVLLEDMVCQGTATLGLCDRNCYYFWREEWLEKVEG